MNIIKDNKYIQKQKKKKRFDGKYFILNEISKIGNIKEEIKIFGF